MRRILFDRSGEPRFYLTGAGVLYNMRDEAIGFSEETVVADRQGRARAHFDGDFLRDLNGYVLAFVKGANVEGAKGAIELPPVKPLKHKPNPQKALLRPFFERPTRPEPLWEWSIHDPEALLRQGDVA